MPDLEVSVVAADLIARGIRRLVLASLSGPLPPVEPGAHITLTTPSGHRRSYSITERTVAGEYVIWISRDPEGRGGSRSLHDEVGVGTVLQATPPRNAFPLVAAESYLFIAGGIGITPIRAMRRAVPPSAASRTIFLTRDREATPFPEEWSEDPNVTLHHSATDGRFDLWDVLAAPDDVTHIYCCASRPLMERVRMLTMHWNPVQVHFEDFAGTAPTGGTGFTVRWVGDDREIEVGPRESMLGALRSAGRNVDSSCESGTCGTCVLQLLSGAADHRDGLLDDAERATRILPCVSRGRGLLVVAAVGRP